MSSNLADILDAHPRHRVEFDLSRVDLGQLTLMELLDAGDAADIPWEDFREALDDSSRQARAFYAIAWVIMRRADKNLTYEDVCEYDLVVTGEIDEAEADRNAEQAKRVVAVAQVARVTPEEAKHLTLHEVAAATELQEARNRRARRRK